MSFICFVFLSVADIKTAFIQLEGETAELKKATRLAELATSSVDGFKLMLAEKMRLENEMKKNYSLPRLRWIKAINRVLIQNYIVKVKIRLGIPVLTARTDSPTERSRPKIFRRSIDNSLLEAKEGGGGKSPHLPSINRPNQLSMMHNNNGSANLLNTAGSLPTLSPLNHKHSTIEKRRRRRAGDGNGNNNEGKYLTRKSYDVFPFPSPTLSPLDPAKSPSLSCISHDSAVPSLLQSYHTTSQKFIPTVSVPTLAELRGRDYNPSDIKTMRLTRI
jgi:hypothetical protein